MQDGEVGRRYDAEGVRQPEVLLDPVYAVADVAEEAGELRARGDGAMELAVHCARRRPAAQQDNRIKHPEEERKEQLRRLARCPNGELTLYN